MLGFILGLVAGLGIAHYFTNRYTKELEKRISDYKVFAEDKINSFLSAFEKGYETQNGAKPFYEHQPEPNVVQLANEENYGLYEEPQKIEYEERIDGIYR